MVRSSALLPFMGFAERIGMPVDRQLDAVGLPSYIWAEPEALIPMKFAFRFVDHLARTEGLAHVGFLVGGETQFQDLGAFGRLILHSLTLHEALVKLSRVIQLYNSAQHIWIDSFEGHARLNTIYSPRSGPGWQFGEQYTLMVLINFIRVAAGQTWSPHEIHLEPTLHELLYGKREVLGGVPAKRARTSALVFDRKLLSAPLRRNPLSPANDGEKDYRALMATAPAADLPASISQLALMSLAAGQAQIAWIASAAGLSVRTLQRRLAELGVDYSSLIDRVRFDSAQVLLADPGRNLIDIALELGYTDASSFTRAFRRWTGAAPSDYRKMHSFTGNR
jgi:AraC-like DNA-binding protein